jgi:hypothetical protein
MKTFLVLLLMSGLSVAQPNSAFDEEHARGVKQNPPGLELTFSTLDGKSVYHLSDEIRYKLVVTAKQANVYTFETATGTTVAGLSDDLVVVSPELAVPVHSRKRAPSKYGGICCESKRHYISEKPSTVEFAFRLSYFNQGDFGHAIEIVPGLFDIKPGDVYVFLQTARILRGWPKSQGQKYTEDGIVVTSKNVLHLTILPDEPKSTSK